MFSPILDFDVADFAAHLSKWMTAQHGKLARHLAADGKFVDEVVGLVSVVDAESGDVVAASPAMLAECPDGSPRHVRRGPEPLNGRNCGRGPASGPSGWQGGEVFSEV